MNIQFNPVDTISTDTNSRRQNVSFGNSEYTVAQRVVKTVVRETATIVPGAGVYSLAGSLIFGPQAIPFFAILGGITTKLFVDAIGQANENVFKYVSDVNIFKIGDKLVEKICQSKNYQKIAEKIKKDWF